MKKTFYILSLIFFLTVMMHNASLRKHNYSLEKRYENLLTKTHELSLSTDDLISRLKSLDESGHVFLKQSENDGIVAQLYKKDKTFLRDPSEYKFQFNPTDFENHKSPFLDEVIYDISKMEKRLKNSEDRMKWISYVVNSVPSMFPTFGYINSHFGERISPVTGEKQLHKGVDIAAPVGTPIFATADGEVGYSGYRGNYGKLISIDHGLSFMTRYAHLSERHVKKGDKVKRGDIIGTVGRTGRTTGAHLHYEVRLNNLHINPKEFLPKKKMYNKPENLFASNYTVGLPASNTFQGNSPELNQLYIGDTTSRWDLWFLITLGCFFLLFLIALSLGIYTYYFSERKKPQAPKVIDMKKYIPFRFKKTPVKFW